MIKQLLYKWFGLVDETPVCNTCEVLREMLERSEHERRELLLKILERDKPEPIIQQAKKEEFTPIQPHFVPWRVRREMLEQEDRHAASILRQRQKDIEDLEKELEISHADATSATSGTTEQRQEKVSEAGISETGQERERTSA